MPLVNCSACGKQISGAAPACPHCGQAAAGSGGGRGSRRGLPTWAKLLLMLSLGMVVLVVFAVNKPSEAELRQAIRDKGKELQAQGVISPLLMIDAPQHAGRFTYHAHLLSSEIKFMKVDGEVITVARGQVGGITVAERW